MARFTAMVVLPTPPLPLPTATMLSMPGMGCGPRCGGPPACMWLTRTPLELLIVLGGRLLLPWGLALGHLSQAMLAAASGTLVAAVLFRRFGDDRRDF